VMTALKLKVKANFFNLNLCTLVNPYQFMASVNIASISKPRKRANCLSVCDKPA
jgi:hypothetical protein